MGKKGTIYEQYKAYHQVVILDKAKEIIPLIYPQYNETFEKVMRPKHMSVGNMFVMRQEMFNAYCSRLFTVLFKLETALVDDFYQDDLSRKFGYLAERLFNVWLALQKLNVYEAPIKMIKEADLKWYRKTLYSIIGD